MQITQDHTTYELTRVVDMKTNEPFKTIVIFKVGQYGLKYINHFYFDTETETELVEKAKRFIEYAQQEESLN